MNNQKPKLTEDGMYDLRDAARLDAEFWEGAYRVLREIAHQAWHALDDSSHTGDHGEVSIRREDYDALSAALDAADGLGDIHEWLQSLDQRLGHDPR